jgi:bla regulator protein blaR1
VDTVLNWLWQGTTVALSAAVVVRFSGARATVRYRIWWLTLTFVLLLPLVPGPAPGAPAILDSVVIDRTQAPAFVMPPIPATVASVAVVLWVVWVALLGCQSVVAVRSLGRFKRSCQPFPSAIELRLREWNRVKRQGRPALLVISDDVSAAAVLGITSPVIAVAPSLIGTLRVEDLDRIVLHEWAHVQRRDDVTNLIQVLIGVVAGWHPGIWWINRQLRSEAEAACDERAALVSGSATEYAACLARLAAIRSAPAVPSLAPGVLSARSVTRRIERVLALARSPRVSPARATTITAAAIVMLAGLTASLPAFALVTLAPPTVVDATASPSSNHVGGDHSIGPAAASPVVTRMTAPRRGSQSRRSSLPLTGSSVTSSEQSATPPATESAAEHAALQPNPAILAPAPSLALAALSSAPGNTLPHPHIDMPKTTTEVTPWGAAADAGVAVGRGSQRAAVATAGFFARLGNKIAKSF